MGSSPEELEKEWEKIQKEILTMSPKPKDAYEQLVVIVICKLENDDLFLLENEVKKHINSNFQVLFHEICVIHEIAARRRIKEEEERAEIREREYQAGLAAKRFEQQLVDAGIDLRGTNDPASAQKQRLQILEFLKTKGKI
jgi:hypothetical protein